MINVLNVSVGSSKIIYGKSQDILWPFIKYEIRLPLKVSAMNIFEETILSLAQYIPITDENISEYQKMLALEPDLLYFIRTRLQNQQLLNQNYQTISPQKNDTSQEENETISLLYDPISKSFFPLALKPNARIISHIEPIINDELTIEVGSQGAPEKKKFRIISHPKDSIIEPSAHQILNVLKESKNQYKKYIGYIENQSYFPVAKLYEDISHEIMFNVQNKNKFDNIHMIDILKNKVELVYLKCKIKILQDSSDFIVENPFGFFMYKKQTNALLNLIKNDRKLYDFIEEIKNMGVKNSSYSDKKTLENILFFGFNHKIWNYKEIYENLREVYLNYNDLGKTAEVRRNAEELMVSYIYDALEKAMIICYLNNQTGFEDYISFNNPTTITKEAINFIKTIGINISEAINHLIRPRIIDINKRLGDVDLKTILTLLILSSKISKTNHHFYKVLLVKTDFFEKLYILHQARNSVKHGDTIQISLDVYEMVHYFIEIIQFILPECIHHQDQIQNTLAQDLLNNDHLLYCALDVQNKDFEDTLLKPYGDVIKKELLQLYMHLESKKNIAQKSDASILVTSIASCLQILFIHIISDHLDSSIQIINKDSLINRAFQRCMELQLIDPNQEKFQIELNSVNLNFIEASMRGESKSLGGNFLGLLLVVKKDILCKIFKKIPSLVLDVVNILQYRGHNRFIEMFYEEKEILKDRYVKIMNHLINLNDE